MPAEHKYLLKEFLATYDQLVFNATIVAYMPAAIASFLTQKAKRKPYFVDPQTHAFQHDITHIESKSGKGTGEIRQSIQNLIQEYGEPVKSRVGKKSQSILPSDFSEAINRAGFCRRVLRFQAEALHKVMESSDTAKYYRFLESKGKGSSHASVPNLVIAPYFYLTPTTFNDWLKVNLSCAKDSRAEATKLGIPLGIQIVISREVLTNSPLTNQLIQAYSSLPTPAAFLVWIDEFPENEAAENELESLIKLLTDLGKIAPVANLYGGFFSVAIARLGVVPNLRGVAHGLEYGEDRSVVPVGGGIPAAKFYYPALHTRLSFRSAIRAIRHVSGFTSVKDFRSKICDCIECKDVIRDDPERDFARFGLSRPISFVRGAQTVTRDFPLTEAREASVRHYMWRKEKEYRGALTLDSVVKDLEKSAKSLARVLSLEETGHCQVWARLLENHRA